MGTFIGHILPGTGFLLLGLWHLYNTVSAHVRIPWHFKTRTWFPLRHPRLRHAELYFIMLGSTLSIAAELFICPRAHQPWAEDDWSIPPNHLNNFEHSTISLFMLIYATLALAADVTPHFHVPKHGSTPSPPSLSAKSFFSSTSIQRITWASKGITTGSSNSPIAIAIFTFITEIFIRTLPVISILRSMSIVFQGTWFIQMGMVLWTPSLLPKDCVMEHTPEHDTVKCTTTESIHVAKALANLQFSWHLAAIVVTTGGLFCLLSVVENRRTAYQHLEERESKKSVFKIIAEEDDVDLEPGYAGSPHGGGSQNSMEMEAFDGLDLER